MNILFLFLFLFSLISLVISFILIFFKSMRNKGIIIVIVSFFFSIISAIGFHQTFKIGLTKDTILLKDDNFKNIDNQDERTTIKTPEDIFYTQPKKADQFIATINNLKKNLMIVLILLTGSYHKKKGEKKFAVSLTIGL